MGKNTVGLALLLLVSCVQPAIAAPGMDVSLEGTSAKVGADASATIAAPLLAMLAEDLGTAGIRDARFSLVASHLRLEEDSTEISVHATGSPKYVNAKTTPYEFADASVMGTSLRPNHQWHVFSVDGLPAPTVKASCREALASEAEAIKRSPWVNAARPATVRSAETATSWGQCGGTAQVAGSFVLSLWQWDATLISNGETRELRTGPQPSNAIPSSLPDVSGVVGRDIQYFLVVLNGTLEIPAASLTTFLSSGTAAMQASNLHLVETTGQVAVAETRLDLHEHDVELTGTFAVQITARGTNSPLAVSVTGAGFATTDGQIVTISNTGGLLANPLLWLLAGVAVLAFIARSPIHYGWLRVRGHTRWYTQPATLRQMRGAVFLHRATKARRRANLLQAEQLLSKAKRLFPESLDASILDGVLALEQEQAPEAASILGKAYSRVPAGHERAEVACLVAEALHACGRGPEAVEWLQRASRDHFPTFQAALDEPRFKNLDGGAWLYSMRTAVSKVVARVLRDPAFA